ncbi:hypothetical protein SmJEL517_g03597 [Synchytrium microbalum]|uniref:Uncharacterized protein n=1 Tax=Synchytrium microbalum TaxID=1806994 RepID=A0A507BXK8_9FUNG|nr:uncharacterized protein SmJEL517_g03597 [Synchytrium microbalum]TPX33517.1 hypothetical protein SmJEL517_g03597 [Synchytrium microbalum]
MWTYDQLPSLNGKNIIITGASAGLGLASAIELAKKGATIFLCVRSQARGDEALQQIRAATDKGVLELAIFDQTDLKSIETFAISFKARGIPLNVLLCNAGVGLVPFELIDGVERHLLINHISHMYLVYLLAPLLKSTPKSRLVMVSARAIDVLRKVPVWETDNLEASKYSPIFAYANSKLANIAFANAMQEKLGAGVYVNSIDPGPVVTNIVTGVSKGWLSVAAHIATALFAVNAREGAVNQVYCSAATEIESLNVHATYFTGRLKAKAVKLANDPKLVISLFNYSEAVIKRVTGAELPTF